MPGACEAADALGASYLKTLDWTSNAGGLSFYGGLVCVTRPSQSEDEI